LTLLISVTELQFEADSAPDDEPMPEEAEPMPLDEPDEEPVLPLEAPG